MRLRTVDKVPYYSKIITLYIAISYDYEIESCDTCSLKLSCAYTSFNLTFLVGAPRLLDLELTTVSLSAVIALVKASSLTSATTALSSATVGANMSGVN